MENQSQVLSNPDPATGDMTLGDAMALPVEESSDTGEMTLEQAMGLPSSPEQFITPIEEKDKQTFMKWTSNAITAGIYTGSSSFNDMLGYIGQFSPPGMLIKSFPGVEKALRETFVTSGREEAERLRNESASKNKAVQFAFDTLSGFANLGVTLPIDLMTGGLAKTLVAGRIAPEITKLLSYIPDFALGTGFRGFTEGVQKEGNVLEKTASGIIGGAEAVMINTVFGKGAGIKEGALVGKTAAEIAKLMRNATFKGFITMPAIGMAEKYYQALKEGRIATVDEVIQGAATGFVYHSIFSALPHLKKASTVGSEKLALGYYERKLDKALNSGNIEKAQEVMAEFMADERVRPEVREPIARLLEYKPKESLEYKPKEGQVEVAKPSPEYLDTINTRLRDLYTMLPSIRKRGDPNMTAAIEREIKDLSATQMELMNQSRQEGFALQEKNRIKTAAEIALEKTSGTEVVSKEEAKPAVKKEIWEMTREEYLKSQPSAGGMAGRDIPEHITKMLKKGVTVEGREGTIKITSEQKVTDAISGKEVLLPKGHEMAIYKLSNGKIWFHDGKDMIIESKQLQDIASKNKVLGETKVKLYHGTSKKSAERIAKEGFNISNGDFGVGVYLTPDQEFARVVSKGQKGEGVVLEPRVSGKLLEVSDNYYEGKRLIDSGTSAARSNLLVNAEKSLKENGYTKKQIEDLYAKDDLGDFVLEKYYEILKKEGYSGVHLGGKEGNIDEYFIFDPKAISISQNIDVSKFGTISDRITSPASYITPEGKILSLKGSHRDIANQIFKNDKVDNRVEMDKLGYIRIAKLGSPGEEIVAINFNIKPNESQYQQIKDILDMEKNVIIGLGSPGGERYSATLRDPTSLEQVRDFVNKNIRESLSDQPQAGGMVPLPKEDAHYLAIKKALEEGKKVPPEVLKDYPELMKTTKEPVSPAIEGEMKTSGLANRLEQEMVTSGIKADMEGKAEYAGITHADQARRAIELVNTNYELAKRIARGETQAPDGLKNISVYNAVKTRAVMEGDVAILRDLGMSKVATEVSQAAQTLGLVERRDPLDPVAAINSIYEEGKKTAKKIFKEQSVEKLVKKDVSDIKKEIKKISPKKETWVDFIKSIQC